MNIIDATFGCELELGDIDTQIDIPSSLGKWDYKDGSIMNSNGSANDPLKKLNRYGGEIQVKPAKTTLDLTNRVLEIYQLFPKKDFNFTTNLHPHIRIPGLKEDLKTLKKIARYIHSYGAQMFDLIDPIPVPVREHNDLQFRGAWKRYLRRKRSHHTIPSQRAFEEMMKAKSTEEFYKAHAPKDQSGKPQFHLVQRAGINLMQLWSDTETIEFRCFTMSPDPKKLRSAFRFTRAFLIAVERERSPEKILKRYDPPLQFQKFWPYDYELDQIFQKTNVRHNKREVAEENYRRLIKQGVLTKEELK